MNAHRIIFMVFMLLCTAAAPAARAADFLSQLHPRISVTEEYSDNINLTPDNKKDDFTTTIRPGLQYSNMGPTSGVQLDASLGYVMYGRDSDLNYVSAGGSLNAKYMTPQHVNFYFQDSFTRSDSSRERELFSTEAENRYRVSTQRERAVYWRNAAAPTIEYQFGAENRVGVSYLNNIYRSESASSSDSTENKVTPFLHYWFTRENGIYLAYNYTDGDFNNEPDLEGHAVVARYTHRVTPRFSLFTEYQFLARRFEEAPAGSFYDYDLHEPAVGFTYAFTSTLTGSAQVGYYWQEPKVGTKQEGLSYKGALAGAYGRTSYMMSFQSGYTEDYFSSQNLGFNEYTRITGSATHALDRKLSVGCLGSIEWLKNDVQNYKDTIWGVSGKVSYKPLKWLSFALEVSHWENDSNVDLNDYEENRAMITVTASY